MNIRITYFYNVRFFSPNMIPVSTAVFDPKWYHDNKGNDHVYLDKRGIYNGVRCMELSPARISDHSCSKDCTQTPGSCSFINAYHDYIYSLDFKSIYKYLNDLSNMLKKTRTLEEEPEIVLLVHEKPDNPCSERTVLVDWFMDNGIEITEFEIKGD